MKKTITNAETKARIVANIAKNTPINNIAHQIECCSNGTASPLYDMTKLYYALSALVIRSKLNSIRCGKNYTYDKSVEVTISDLSRIYDYNRFCLKVDLQTAGTKAEQCKAIADKNSNTLAYDMIQTASLILIDYIAQAQSAGAKVDLLTPFEKPYADKYRDGTEKTDSKKRYKVTNVIREMQGAVKTVFDNHRTQTEKTFTSFTDCTGKVKLPKISAISDTYGDIELTDDIKQLLSTWIDGAGMKKIAESVIRMYYIDGIEQSRIAEKHGISTDAVKQYIQRFKEKLLSTFTDEKQAQIKAQKPKKVIAMYNSFGDMVAKYESISQCAKALSVSRTAIQKALRLPKIATCKGYVFDVLYI